MIFNHSIGYWLVRLLLFVVFSLLIYILADKLAKRKWKIIFVAPVIALVLTLLTLFFLQGHSILFKEEASVLAGIHTIKKQLGFGFTSPTFIDSNFILINTALNPEIIPYKDANYEDSAKQVITNRKMLTSFLKFLNESDSLIDMVVCDIVFNDSMRGDKNLIEIIEQLQKNNKVLLAYNKSFAAENPGFYKSLDVASFGDVTKVKDEAFYFSHELLNDENIPSLPYAMYLKLNNIKSPSIGKYFITEDNRIVQKNFIPEFSFVNEKLMYQKPITGAETQDIKLHADTQLYNNLPRIMYTLGQAAGEDGQREILDLLSMKRRDNQTIVLIGNFSDAYIDRHASAYGDLYGTTLLLNEFYFINEGHHRMSVFVFVLFTITLFVLYSLVIGWVLLTKIKSTMHTTTKSTISMWKFILNWVNDFFEYIVYESHFLFLFFIALLIDIIFGKIINVMGLLYFFILFSSLLKFFFKKHTFNYPLKKYLI